MINNYIYLYKYFKQKKLIKMKVSLIFFLFLGISCALTGIDVSTYQNWITWSKVVKEKYFAIIRAGYGLGHIDDH